MTQNNTSKMSTTITSNEELERLVQPLVSGQYSDFTIRLGDYSWKVHRVNLSARSGFFRRACGGGFQEAAAQEITLYDDDPDALARMLIWIYTGDFPAQNDEDPLCPAFLVMMGRRANDEGPLTLYATLYGLCLKYDIPALAETTSKCFNDELHDSKYRLDDFIGAVKVIYDTAAEEEEVLKGKIITEAQKHRSLLACQPAFHELVKSTPDFAVDLATKYAGIRMLWCDACQIFIHVSQKRSELRNCVCGFSGLCKKTIYCHDPAQIAKKYLCHLCNGTGDDGTIDPPARSLRPASRGASDVQHLHDACYE